MPSSPSIPQSSLDTKVPTQRKRSRDESAQEDREGPDPDLESLVRPMKRLRLGRSDAGTTAPPPGEPTTEPWPRSPRVSPKSPSTPIVTVSEPREDDELDGEVDTRDLVPMSRLALHPRALAALLRQSALWKLVTPVEHPDNSRALIPYSPPGNAAVLHDALLRYLRRARREDEPDALPESTVLVESASSDDESDGADDMVNLTLDDAPAGSQESFDFELMDIDPDM